jgi:hypothetical protein
MSQEEAFGYASFDLMRGSVDLVYEEARKIGKRLDYHASREKKSHDNAKEKAKDQRKNARVAARNNEAKVASLNATLAAIDMGLEAKCAERLAKPVDLGACPIQTRSLLMARHPCTGVHGLRIRTRRVLPTAAEAREEAEEAQPQ